jgi:hypothetical protein
MACYVVTLRETYAGQQCINRFPFVSTVEPTGIIGSLALLTLLGAVDIVAGAFPVDTLLYAIQNIQAAEVTFDEIECRNLYDVTDFYVVPFVGDISGGTAVGAAMSPTMAYGFFSNRLRTDIHRGTKRFVGANDTFVGEGGIIQGDGVTAAVALAAALSAVQNPDNTDAQGTYNPTVFGYQAYTAPSGRRAYKPRDTEAEQLGSAAIGVTWDYYSFVRTQASRQYGHGS